MSRVCTYWIGQVLKRLAVDGQQNISLLDLAALLSRLVGEKLLYPDQAAEVPGGRIQLTH